MRSVPGTDSTVLLGLLHHAALNELRGVQVAPRTRHDTIHFARIHGTIHPLDALLPAKRGQLEHGPLDRSLLLQLLRFRLEPCGVPAAAETVVAAHVEGGDGRIIQ